MKQRMVLGQICMMGMILTFGGYFILELKGVISGFTITLAFIVLYLVLDTFLNNESKK